MKIWLAGLSCLVFLAACRKEVTTQILTGPNGTLDKQAVGRSAHDLLSADTYTSLSLNIQYAPGMKPQDQSIHNLVNFLNTYLHKPAGITYTETATASLGKDPATMNDITSYEDRNRQIYSDGNTLSVYLFLADAGYEQTDVIGLSFRNTSIVVFEKTIQSRSGGLNQASRITVETGTLEHELGHLLGLVNTGSSMVTPHEDTSHKGHCSNNQCLMYYAIETSGLMNPFGNAVPSLDQDCINDLRANGGK